MVGRMLLASTKSERERAATSGGEGEHDGVSMVEHDGVSMGLAQHRASQDLQRERLRSMPEHPHLHNAL